MESNMFLVPDTYLAKIHKTEANRTGSYRNPCWSEQRRSALLWSFLFLVCDTRWTAASRVFKQSAWIFDNPICMQTFSEFLCQHKIAQRVSMPAQDRGYLIVISGTPDHQSEITYWPASVWKSKQRIKIWGVQGLDKVVFMICLFWENFTCNSYIIIRQIPGMTEEFILLSSYY